MTTTEAIRGFLLDAFPGARGKIEFDDDISLLESGIIDSTGVLELVTFIEDHFGIVVEDTELLPDNLDSIACIRRYLAGKGVTEGGDPSGSPGRHAH